MSEITVRAIDPRNPVRRDRNAFIDLPYRLHGKDPQFVAPLRMEAKALVDPRKNPWFEHGEAALFVAWRDGKAVARASAQVDRLHSERWHDGAGFFGLVEAADEAALAPVMGAAEEWLRGKGCALARGPYAFNINGDQTGLLVEGFDTPPYVLMGHNPPGYPTWIEALGYRKAKDLLAWSYAMTGVPARAKRLVERVRNQKRFRIRSLDRRNLEAEVKTVLSVFNEAWSSNWGFIPATDAEAKKMAKDLGLILDPAIAVVAEDAEGGEVAGVAVGIPNLHEALHGGSGGLLSLIRVAWRALFGRFRTGRLVLFGIRARYRKTHEGLALLLLQEMWERGAARGYVGGELGWTLEDNEGINAAAKLFEAKPYKRYRVYEKPLGG